MTALQVVRVAAFAVVTGIAFALAGCTSTEEAAADQQPQVDAPLPRPEPTRASAQEPGGSVFDWFGSGSSGGSARGVGVNEYLWRATLDTLSFMPMDSADPFGGIVKTNWYTPAQTPSERLRVSVFILDTRLRADALRVSVFKQTKDGADWKDSSVDPDTVAKLENLILTKARELRLAGS